MIDRRTFLAAVGGGLTANTFLPAAENDRRKNVLGAFGVPLVDEEGKKITAEAIQRLSQERPEI